MFNGITFVSTLLKKPLLATNIKVLEEMQGSEPWYEGRGGQYRLKKNGLDRVPSEGRLGMTKGTDSLTN